MNNDRRMATPHYRSSYEKDMARAITFTVTLAFFAGSMIGAALAVGWMSP